MSIAESVKKGDIQGAADVLAQVLKDKPKVNISRSPPPQVQSLPREHWN
jgi:hypothetical protein